MSDEFAKTKSETINELRKSLEARMKSMLNDPYYLATQIMFLYYVLGINDKLERRDYSVSTGSEEKLNNNMGLETPTPEQTSNE